MTERMSDFIRSIIKSCFGPRVISVEVVAAMPLIASACGWLQVSELASFKQLLRRPAKHQTQQNAHLHASQLAADMTHPPPECLGTQA